MRRRSFPSSLKPWLTAAPLLCLALAGASPVFAGCKLAAVTLPVTMMGARALLPTKINGADAMFMVDSGAFFSMITPANAARFDLPREALPFGMTVSGATGLASARVGTVKVFTLANTPLHRIQFIVTGGEIGEGAVGAIGQNVLGLFDVDYDLAHGTVGLLTPTGCGESALAYWAGDKPYSVIKRETDYTHQKTSHTLAPVYLNGVRLTAMLDTGAGTSIISRQAAARAGVTPTDPGVTPAGRTSGIGERTVSAWLGRFKSFKIGGEDIQNSKIMFGDVTLGDADMLLGADFFLSHHVLVSNSQSKIYFTYNGGPVFRLDDKPREVWGGNGAAPPKEAANDPTDAAGLALRGAASESRGDHDAAIADLGRALALAPASPDYLYQRGRAYLGSGQPVLARADFDQALKLRPDDVPVLIARANLEFRDHDRAAALADLAVADKSAAKQDDARLRLARLYEYADLLPTAIAQYDLWIDAHPEASETPQALNGRGWARALLGQDLDKALIDCDRALRIAPRDPKVLDTRGLVRLRRGEFDAAIRDYDAALAIDPKLDWSLYGRGLAKQRKGDAAGGAADLAAAVAINPKLPEQFKRRGIAV